MTTYSGISQAAFDLIVAEEVSSQTTYTARYQRPERPGGASGITIGIGYDCGYATPERLRADWKGHIPDAMINALVGVAGLTGDAAQARLAGIRPLVLVPWQAAIDVFANTDIPRWAATVRKALPNCDKLSPDCFGALVSLAYNRGSSFSKDGDRYAEMRAIKTHMAAQQFDKIPGEFRSMKRLWVTPSVRGVALRRDHEAALFLKGLSAPIVGTDAQPAPIPLQPANGTIIPREPTGIDRPDPVPPVTPVKPAASTTTKAATGAVVGAGGGALGAAAAGYGWLEIGLSAFVVAGLGTVVVLLIRKFRS